MIDSEFLHELERFSLIVRKKVTSKYAGERKSAYSGSGTIFRDHRQYAIGDNYKAIDWRVFARTDDLYIKVYEEERNMEVHVLLDSSKSMEYKGKFEFSGKIGLGMAFLALKNNEKVHFATFSEDIDMFKGKKGSQQVMSMLSHFNQVNPKGKTNLGESLRLYRPFFRSKSFVVIVSDFLMPIEHIARALQQLKKHKVKLIQVLDIEEKDMPLEGDYNLIDSESNANLKTYISRRGQMDYVERLQKHVDQIKELAQSMNMEFHQVSTEMPLFDSFFEIVGNVK